MPLTIAGGLETYPGLLQPASRGRGGLPMADQPRASNKRRWQEIAAEVSQENDPQIEKLSHELNEAMLADERRKAEERLVGLGFHFSSLKRSAV
jgi:hypothetical protein